MWNNTGTRGYQRLRGSDSALSRSMLHGQEEAVLSQLSKRPDSRGFTLIEIMIAVLIIGVLLSIAGMNFIKARDSTRLKTCISNLRRIDDAKECYAMEWGKGFGDVVDWPNLVPTYVRKQPECPSRGDYTLLPIGSPADCTISDHDQ